MKKIDSNVIGTFSFPMRPTYVADSSFSVTWSEIGFVCLSSRAVEVLKGFTQIQTGSRLSIRMIIQISKYLDLSFFALGVDV